MSTSNDPMRDRITLHGLGFIQVQLPGNQRLHVWHPDLPRRRCFEDSAIHNHRFAFDSHVLVGALRNVDYLVQEAATGSHLAYSHEAPRTASGGRPWTLNSRVSIESFTDTIYQAGQQYRMRAYDYHRTEALGDGRVATLMIKKQEGEAGARSLCRIGIEPDANFDRYQWPAARLWSVVLEVLGAEGLMASNWAMDAGTEELLP